MNYLIVEGYKDAAEKFSQETGVRPMVEFTAIEDRMQVRTCIQTGRLQDAIDRINRLNPDVMGIGQFVNFRFSIAILAWSFSCKFNSSSSWFVGDLSVVPLNMHKKCWGRWPKPMYTLIGDNDQPFLFQPEFLSELERAMTLFIHDPTGPLATALPAAEMLEPFYRVRTANEVNAAILAAQSQEKGK